ncbi:MAG: Asp-tRNA(Asn)/Glu-tRNA(Gln) amidotransferase GatCAB subunit A [Gammaproteobacteria bacterium]|nr:Asp-tRNA(Asn)/Glu-tRNA(Gln) amidotransferase GatCAB subunit A [Gammaproteobacteria bacterium]|tara:strand:- start:165887 stop:167350 length:1464 start_codon:yes stop_codon:yes gene_type:complete
MYNKTLVELREEIVTKKVSSYELTKYFLERIKKFDKEINSFITITEEYALKTAKKIDQEISKNNMRALSGIPLAQKDIFCTENVKTTCGSKMLESFVSPYDATVVKKLKNAGSVMLGKTNMDEFAMGSSNETSFFGEVKNPWNFEYVPGGSSGGSASSVAARLVPCSTGTDTGGSIRQPASLCGVSGIKPTYGRVSRYGMIAFASSLDQAGVFAKTAKDCALLLTEIAGYDEKDSTSAEEKVINYFDICTKKFKPITIGVPEEFLDGLDNEVRKVFDDAIEIFKKEGCKIKKINLSNSKLGVSAYQVVAPAECSSNLSRYDGVRYGYRAKNVSDLEDLYKRSRSEGFGKEVKRRILVGTYALSAGYYDAYYLKAQKIRQLITNDFLEAFKNVDLILGPTTPDTAFKIGSKANDPIAMYLSDVYTVSANLAGLPAMSIPMGFKNELPLGLQIIGSHFDEDKILSLASHFQEITNWHDHQPKQKLLGLD